MAICGRISKGVLTSNGYYKRLFHTSSLCSIKNYYQILGVPKNATPKDIKSAYYEKAKSYHPDANRQTSGSLKFQEISEAYEILSDDAKRRAYDSTSRSRFSEEIPRPDDRTRWSGPREPISMNHIQHVYKTLNREEFVEEPKFRPFEDHNYPGSTFNRFEYTRHWDTGMSCWVYTKRSTAAQYQRQMKEKQRILQICLSVLMFGFMAFFVNYRFVLNKYLLPKEPEPSKEERELQDYMRGLYIITKED